LGQNWSVFDRISDWSFSSPRPFGVLFLEGG
jgi:hypothetical protein